ncbi:MAG: hypothetical protein JJU45_07045 [Acidimicrobiia bacterium]|nr:hypothetical protein [Acidimicrobiia bacterium]
MRIPLTDGWAVVVGSVVWAVAGTAVGYVMHRLPVTRFDHDTWLTRLRPREVDGRVYERRWAIRRWKRWLPEAGDAFAGGFSKKRLGGRSTAHLERFVAETRRAELTHWVVMACGPFFVLWSPLWLAAVMVVFGVVANLPCLVAQRYNRARLLRLLGRRAATGSVGPVPSTG